MTQQTSILPRLTQPTAGRPDRQAVVRAAHAARARFLAETLAETGAALRRALARLVPPAPRRAALAGGR